MVSALTKITLHEQIHQIREHRPVEIYKEWNQHNITITLKKNRGKINDRTITKQYFFQKKKERMNK